MKLWVIITTDGRVVATGAAGAFFDLGLYSLLAGSTGLGVRLAVGQEPAMRGVMAVVGPVAFVLSFALFSAIGYALVAAGRAIVGHALPAYLLEEGGIFIAAVVGLAVGAWLLVGLALRRHRRDTPGRRVPRLRSRVR